MADAPTITGASSTLTDRMSGGDQIQLTGSGFTDASAVKVGDRDATTFAVDSDTQITLTLPSYDDYSAGSSFGFKVTTPNGDNPDSGGIFIQYGTPAATPDPPAVTGPAPTITAATLAHTDRMAGGDSLQLTGTGFTGATSVKVGDRDATSFTVDSDTQISLTLPSYDDYSAGSSFGFKVTTNNGTNADSGGVFIGYGTPAATPDPPATTGPAPTITGASHTYTDRMDGYYQIQIMGTGFTGATSVKVGDREAAAHTVDSDTQISLTLPSYDDYSAGSSFGFKVTTNNGTNADSGGIFIQYGTAAATPDPPAATGPAPTITGASHTYTDRMDGYYQIQIMGTGFTGATAVQVGDRAAPTFTVDSDTQISLTLPSYNDYSAGSSFGFKVTTNNGTNADSGGIFIQYGTAAP